MSDPSWSETDSPRPGRIRTRQDFARELTLLREQAGLTVRQVAVKVGVQGAHSTLGDWFAGRGLPSPMSIDLLVEVLQVCGVGDTGRIGQWMQAWRRVRRAPGRRVGGQEPYRGLASYQPEDADWFFGRQALTEELIARLADRHAPESAVQMVVGASGCGKSSLLRAGMIPALRGGRVPGSSGWPVVLFTPGCHPVDALAARLAALAGIPAGEAAGAIRSAPDRCAFYAQQAAVTPAGRTADRYSAAFDVACGGVASSAGNQLVVVVDQFEETFTACADSEERRLFVAALCAAASDAGQALVVLGLRADFYAQALRYPELVAAVQAGQLTVGPMSEAELREAIVSPAHKANVDIEEGLVELLLREVSPRGGSCAREGAHEAGVLPLLSHALYVTWCQGQGRRLAIADYRAVGGIEGAVAASASKVYQELTGPQRELARRLFLSLVHVAPDTADTRRRATIAELPSECCDARPADREEVLDRFIAQRLITADTDTVEISHEALLTAWPQLQTWLDTDRAGLIIGRQLTDAAATWRREHRDPAALYRGTRLAAAQEWVEGAGPRADLTPLARDFLDSSIQREQEELRAARRRTRRLHQLVGGLTVLFLLAATATVLAVDARETATQQRNQALSRKVAGETTALRISNPALAAQVGLAAYRLAPTAEARSSLLSTFGTPYATRLIAHTEYVHKVAFSPDGRTLVTASADNTVRLWDVAKRHHPTTLATTAVHTDYVSDVAFSPDGRILATASGDRTVRLWDVTDRRHPSELVTIAAHTDTVNGVAFSPDGRILATASGDRTARLWDVTDRLHPTELATIAVHTDYVNDVAFSPDGRILATGSGDRTARLWDVTDRRHPSELATIAVHTDAVWAVTFSPDGRILATGSADHTVRLWDVGVLHHPTTLATIVTHTDAVYSVAFSSDGHTLATSSADNTARLWNITDPRRPIALASLKSHTNEPIDSSAIVSVAFSPDGRTLATASYDHTARLWDIPGPSLAGEVGPVAFSLDSRTLATVSNRDGTLVTGTWDVSDPYHPSAPTSITTHTGDVGPVAFSLGSHTLATISNRDRRARLWDLSDPQHLAELATVTLAHDTGPVYTGAFSPDGHTLTLLDIRQRRMWLWDVTDGSHPRELATLTGHTNSVNEVLFSPDGQTMATVSYDHTARLWDVTDRGHPGELATLIGHTDVVWSAAFSPDGRTLATGSYDHTARLWDVTDRGHPVPLAILTGHTDSVNAVAFSPDGRTLATGSSDRTARLWDVTDRRHPVPLASLIGHAGVVWAAVFSPDGRLLATGSPDGTTRLWETNADRVSARICRIVQPTITRAEWDEYFPGLAYEAPCRSARYGGRRG